MSLHDPLRAPLTLSLVQSMIQSLTPGASPRPDAPLSSLGSAQEIRRKTEGRGESGYPAEMPTDTTDRLCRELRGLREAMGLSGAEAGRRCEPPMTGQQWGRIEKGSASTVRQFERCFSALGASIEIKVSVPTVG